MSSDDSGSDSDDFDYEASQIDCMNRFVEEFSDFATVPQPSSQSASKPNVVLTGASGGLGSHILNQLLNNPTYSSRIDKIYCLVRASDPAQARAKVNETLARGLLPPITGDRVIALPSSLEEDRLGLSPETYEEIRKSVGYVLHIAWTVNFNLSVESFKPQVEGIRHLIDLAITARNGHPASFFYASSVSAVSATPSDIIHEEVSVDPEEAPTMGYGRSKWVAEQLVHLAHQTRGIRSEVFRIGQLAGDTQNGVWTETEAVPLMIKSALTLRALPDLNGETVYWLPVDQSAQTCLDIIFGDVRRTVWHVVNPGDQQTTWTDILASLTKAGLVFDIVSNEDWLEKMSFSTDFEKNPAIKLLDYYQNKMDDEEPEPVKLYETIKTKEASSTLRSAGKIEDDLVAKFINNWRRTGFIV